jgi:hypothetical protein
MTDISSPSPGPFTGDLRDPDVPLLREHFRDVTRWVIGDAVGDRLTADQSDALAEEIAVILAAGLGPALRREVEHQAEVAIARLQNGPVSFDFDHQIMVDGYTAPNLLKLMDAVGRLVDADVTEAISGLHETHRQMLYNAHHAWLVKNDPEYTASSD